MEESGADKRRQERKDLVVPLSGFLLDLASNRMLSCWTTDVSKSGIGIVAEERLQNGTDVLLTLAGEKHALRVMWARNNRDETSSFAYRYGLIALNERYNLEQLFQTALSGLGGRSVADAPQILHLDDPHALDVSAKTWGSRTSYHMNPQTLSRGELILQNGVIKIGAPFTRNTLVELSIDTTHHFGVDPVECLGRVVDRKASKESPNADAYAVRITEIDSDNMTRWENCLKLVVGKSTG